MPESKGPYVLVACLTCGDSQHVKSGAPVAAWSLAHACAPDQAACPEVLDVGSSVYACEKGAGHQGDHSFWREPSGDDGSFDHCGCCAHRRSEGGCGGTRCPCGPYSRELIITNTPADATPDEADLLLAEHRKRVIAASHAKARSTEDSA